MSSEGDELMIVKGGGCGRRYSNGKAGKGVVWFVWCIRVRVNDVRA